MATPGPLPSNSGTRRRRNAPTIATTKLSTDTSDIKTPPWPKDFAPHPKELPARIARATVARIERERDETKDRRKLGRLARELDKAQAVLAMAEEDLARVTKAERAYYGRLWKMPQARRWQDGTAPERVANYVRWDMAGWEDIKAATLAQKLGEALFLDPASQARGRLEYVRAEEAEEQQKKRREKAGSAPTPAAPPPAGPDPRHGMFAVS